MNLSEAAALNQRWTGGRDSYRPAGEVIDPAEYDVHAIDEDGAKAFVLEHHYSGTYPSARRRFGLFRRGVLVGVAVFSHPSSDKVHTNVFEISRATDALTLGRFVLVDDVKANGETWFLARCFDQLKREGFAGVVSFSDPTRRTNRRGEVVFCGHHGGIYQAFNARFLGLGKARTQLLLPDGRILDERTVQKIRKVEQGVDYAVEELVRQGAAPPGSWDEPGLKAWLRDQLPRVARKLRHPGNLRYAWAFGRTAVKMESEPYVKPRNLAAYLEQKRRPKRLATAS